MMKCNFRVRKEWIMIHRVLEALRVKAKKNRLLKLINIEISF